MSALLMDATSRPIELREFTWSECSHCSDTRHPRNEQSFLTNDEEGVSGKKYFISKVDLQLLRHWKNTMDRIRTCMVIIVQLSQNLLFLIDRYQCDFLPFHWGKECLHILGAILDRRSIEISQIQFVDRIFSGEQQLALTWQEGEARIGSRSLKWKQ